MASADHARERCEGRQRAAPADAAPGVAAARTPGAPSAVCPHSPAWHEATARRVRTLLQEATLHPEKQRHPRLGELIPGRLFVGGVLEAEDEGLLNEYGVTHVVSALGKPPASALRLKTFYVNAEDDPYYRILDRHAAEVCEWLDSELAATDAVALIHCASGVNRSVVLGCAFAVGACKELAARAPECFMERLALLLQRLLATRSPVLTNEGFVDQLLARWPCCAPLGN